MNKMEKIIETISKLNLLNEKSINLVSNAIDSCLAVQALEQMESPSGLVTKVSSINNKVS